MGGRNISPGEMPLHVRIAKAVRSRVNVSMSSLSLFVLVIALLGGAAVSVFALSSNNGDFEAEIMTLPRGAASVRSDSTASGGQYVLFSSNGTASRTTTTPSVNTVTITARGQACNGNPNVRLTIDGITVGNQLVSTTAWAPYSFALSTPLTAGSHKIGVIYTNDSSGRNCDRNLLVDKVEFTPAPTPSATSTPSDAPSTTPAPSDTPSATPTSTPTGTPSPTPSATPSPTPIGGTSLLRPFGLGFAPYDYVPWGGSLTADKSSTGANTLVAAFIQGARGCTPAWDGDSSLTLSSQRANAIATDITSLRAAGGDAVVSLGGASGTDLAVACTSNTSLKQAYRSVIDKYGLTMMDLDIEGAGASNSSANARRASTLASLQQDLPALKIWVTLAVDQTGLDSRGKSIVQQMHDSGVVLSGVNIMVMDYGVGSNQIGQLAMQSAQGTFNQLKSIYPASTNDELWRSIGMTAMIGINDTKPETFTIANAQAVHDFAIQNGVGMLSYWDVGRDVACPNNAATLSDSCSGVVESPYQFAQTMNIPALH